MLPPTNLKLPVPLLSVTVLIASAIVELPLYNVVPVAPLPAVLTQAPAPLLHCKISPLLGPPPAY